MSELPTFKNKFSYRLFGPMVLIKNIEYTRRYLTSTGYITSWCTGKINCKNMIFLGRLNSKILKGYGENIFDENRTKLRRLALGKFIDMKKHTYHEADGRVFLTETVVGFDIYYSDYDYEVLSFEEYKTLRPIADGVE